MEAGGAGGVRVGAESMEAMQCNAIRFNSIPQLHVGTESP